MIIIGCFLLGGCCPRGYGSEMTACRWRGELKGGGEAELSFDGESACLTLKNGGEQARISGRYIADEEELVIFDEEVGQNYGFEYKVSKTALELRRGEGLLRLEKE